MYCIQLSIRNTLITPQEVLEYANVSDNMDLKRVRNSIAVAEERFIVPLLGRKTYDDFCASKNITVTVDNSSTLRTSIDDINALYGIDALTDAQWNTVKKVNAIELCSEAYQTAWVNFLCQICADAVHYQLIVNGWVQTTQAGEMQNAPKNIAGNNDIASAGIKDVQMKLDSIVNSRITTMSNAFKSWMCTGAVVLPYYDTSYCGVNSDEKLTNGFGIAINAYDDRENEQYKRELGITKNYNGWN